MAPDPFPTGALKAVMQALFDHGPMSRAALSRLTGLSKQTTSAAIATLEAEGWVRPTGKTQGGLGRAAPTYEPYPSSCYAIGIDLGGTRLRIALADLSGTIVAEVDEPVQEHGIALIEWFGRLAMSMLDERSIERSRLRGAALAVAGVPDAETGAVLFAPNLPMFDTIDVVAETSRALGCAVRVENDVNMAALGEQWMGEGGEHFAFVAYGTGIGMGIVSGGRLIRGARGAAGEIAWLPVGADPFDTRVHGIGAFESAVGSHALVSRSRGLQPAPEDVRQLFERLIAGDDGALAIVDEAARTIAVALVAVRAVVDPSRVVLGGSIGQRAELIGRVRSWLARAGAADLDVQASRLGARAGLIGAVGLGLTTARAALLGSAKT